MINRIKGMANNPLVSGSLVMIIGSNFVNAVAYLYHLILGRMLGPSSYSELAAVLSLLGLISTAFTFLGLVVMKFISGANENEKEVIYSWFVKKTFYLGLFVFLVFLILTPNISGFLHLGQNTTLFIGPILFVFLMNFVFKSFLQGLLKFGRVVVVSALDLLGRLILGVLLVYLGYSSFGATFGILLGAVLSTLAAWWFLKNYKIRNSGKFEGAKKVLTYALPVFVATLSTTSFFSTDVVLVKHYFDAHDAGIYASLSNLGKIIFFSTAPIASVMFPIISKKYARGESYGKVLILSLLLTLLIAGGVVILYFLFPREAIGILYGSGYLAGVPYLLWMGIFMTLFALSNLLITFYLSLERGKIAVVPAFFALVQIGVIRLFHEDLMSVIRASLMATTLMFITLIIYFVYDKNAKSIRGKKA